MAPEPPADTGEWWAVAGGILAIPTLLLGLVLTFFLIRKANLEGRKLARELEDMESQSKGTATRPEGDASGGKPAANHGSPYELLVRAVLLYVILQVWDLIRVPLNMIQLWGSAGEIVAVVPGVARLLVIYGLGAPLLVDALAYLGIQIPRPLQLLGTPNRLSFLVVGLILVVLFLATFVMAGTG